MFLYLGFVILIIRMIFGKEFIHQLWWEVGAESISNDFFLFFFSVLLVGE
jgi:hypothetical protein